MKFATLGRIFGGWLRTEIGADIPQSRGHLARQRLVEAYGAVFDTRRTDVQIVLADLAEASSFYGCGLSTDTEGQRAYLDGQRSVFLRLTMMLNPTEEERAAIADAARHEASITATQGEIT